MKLVHSLLLSALVLGLPAFAPDLRAQTPAALTTLHGFGVSDTARAAEDGTQPRGSLLQGSDGNFYGTTATGGTNGTGTVFRLTPEGTVTTLYSFDAVDGNGTNRDGTLPDAGLLQAGDGNFYGATTRGGAHGVGTVFRLTAEGAITTLHSFEAEPHPPAQRKDGTVARLTLVESGDGALYGTTTTGGANGAGTVFRLTHDGVFTPLHDFSGPDGAGPDAGLVQGNDGNFYGTATTGGANGTGAIFQLTYDGVLTVLHSFGAEDGDLRNSDGARPYGSLIQGSGGSFFGTTSEGGAGGSGTVFRLTRTGIMTTLHSFGAVDRKGSNDDGALPQAGLLAAADGAFFYGTTTAGGAAAGGTVFRITRAGVLTTLHHFAGSDGSGPQAGLVQGRDGQLYGTTSGGGAAGQGTLFRLQVASLRGLAATTADEKSAKVHEARKSTLPVVDLTATSLPVDDSAADAGGTFWVSRTGGDASKSLTVNVRSKQGASAPAAIRQITLPGSQTQIALSPAELGAATAGTSGLKATLLPGSGYTVGARSASLRSSAQTAAPSLATAPFNLPIMSASGTISTWLGNAGNPGNWSNASLWNGGIPDSANADARIDGNKTGINSIVILDSTRTVGALTVDKGDTLILHDSTNLALTNAGGFTGDDTITNNSTISIGDNTQNDNVALYFTGPATLVGAGTVKLTKGNAFLFANNHGDRPTIGAGATVSGVGNLGNGQTAFTNNGTVTANLSGQALYINPGSNDDFTNGSSGVIHAENGGVLQLTTGTFAAGSFAALDGSQVQVFDTTVSGATLTTAGSGVVTLSNTVTLANVTNAGKLVVHDNSSAYLSGVFTNNAALSVGDNTQTDNAALLLASPVSLAGAGTITLAKGNSFFFASNSGDRLTIGANVTINGLGYLGNNQTAFTNYGLITVRGSGNFFNVAPGGDPDADNVPASFINSTYPVTDKNNVTTIVPGVVEARDGGTISFTNGSSVPVTNQGLFQVTTATADNSSFTLPSGSLTNLASATPAGGTQATGTLTGGTFLVAATGTAPGTATLSFGGTGEITVNAANGTINGTNALFPDFNGLADNQGTFSLLGQRPFTAPGSLKDEGKLVIDAGSTLQIRGDFTESNTSVLSVIVGGAATQGPLSPGIIQINGNAALAGTLALRLSSAATQTQIKATDTITIGSIAATPSGSFANVANGQRLNTADALGSFEVDYGPNAANPTRSS